MLLIDKATEMQAVLIELSIIHSHKTLVVFLLPSTIVLFEPSLQNIKAFGTDSEPTMSTTHCFVSKY